MKRNLFHSVFLSFLAGVVVFFAVATGWFSSLNGILSDGIYQRGGRIDSNIKIIAIDEKTLEGLGQFENWTREPYARLIQTLGTSQTSPKVIGIDVLFVNEKGEEDALLVESCRNYPHVVLAGNLVFGTKIESENGEFSANRLHIELAEEPFEGLGKYTKSGFANTVKDGKDGLVRYALLEQDGYVSFALQLVREYDETAVSVQEDGGMFIDYTSPANGYETFSMIDVLRGEIDPAIFDDSIVLVGATAAGMGDSHSVPIGKGSSMCGVEIHANIVQGLLEGRSLRPVSSWMNGIIAGTVGMILSFFILRSKLLIGLFLAVFTAVGNYTLALFLDGRGVVINVVSLPIVILAVFVIHIAGKYITERLHKKKVIAAFKQYVAPQVVEDIAKKRDYKIELGGVKKPIAVLFVDIRGFTSLSEKLEPEEVVAILNEYLEMVTAAVFRHGGTLDKFIGDAAMALFNAPFDSEDYLYKALLTAKEIRENSAGIFEKLSARYGAPLGCGIGVNCGDAVVGNIGCDFRMDYTAIGDTVNTAARLESSAKSGEILISGAVYDALCDRISAFPVEGITLKGKNNKIQVYCLEG